ncbi:HlyD family efflux transporter periplasmic adaptor subunit [Phorcysia thermohydrogeniphila]|uniref:Alginate biosynthesis protein Alg44 n=1 Tax=Phorcysia thermohydrogeniphila TaxID=936138 RepID=A0A4V2PDR7_9BACT|nr:HlyD family efflux transporter periplasmic adaptor subunit [Phorcysia thermohydrogeniphila]TCK06336.1 alginate biosynthesis protein Alg44 [Phorcysia thermohydrogeniphila]
MEDAVKGGGSKVKFKAEPTRHFPRYKIPAFVEVDGKKYRLKDWSIGGCAIFDLPEEYLEKKWAVGNFVIPFDTFDAVIKDVKFEFLRKNPDGTIGCRFANLRPDQISLLQDVIEAFLEGVIVTLDGLINIIRREDLREALEAQRPQAPKRGGLEEFIRRLFILFMFLAIIGIGVLFVLKALYSRVYLVKAVSAFYDAPLKVVKTPVGGFFSFKRPVKEGDIVKKGQVLGFLKAPGRVSFVVPSSVTGKVVEVHVSDGDALEEGDPIISVLPESEKIRVVAHVLHGDVERLKLGQKVKVLRPDGKVITGRIVDIDRASPEPPSSRVVYDRLVIDVPPESCTIDDIGRVVSVEIDLTPQKLKPIFNVLP